MKIILLLRNALKHPKNQYYSYSASRFKEKGSAKTPKRWQLEKSKNPVKLFLPDNQSIKNDIQKYILPCLA
jgi:hypothetical protein